MSEVSMQQIVNACKESGVAYASRQLGLNITAIRKRLMLAGIEPSLFDGRKKRLTRKMMVAKLEQEVRVLAYAVVAMQAAMEKQRIHVEIEEIPTVNKAIILANNWSWKAHGKGVD